eukprot:PhF_6_TR2759/c0_g1_i1/m.4451
MLGIWICPRNYSHQRPFRITLRPETTPKNPAELFGVYCEECVMTMCSHCPERRHYETTCEEAKDVRLAWKSATGPNGLFANNEKDETTAKDQRTKTENEISRVENLKVNFQQAENIFSQTCKRCPHCNRQPIEKAPFTCDAMVCGRNTHGGNQQSGCGVPFSWSSAPPYVPAQTQHYDDLLAALRESLEASSGTVTHPEYTVCSACGVSPIQGSLRFECIHCPPDS